MGLAQAKKRAKLSHDPQNTHWARDTTGYGHKLLLSQGWQPGDTLGAQSAAHKEHFTQASSSHIRAVLREDNLGLGAKVGSGQAAGQCTGLDAFQNLLGRLNGKSEEKIARESEARQQYTRNSFAEQKYGMKFVKAGLLHGEKEFGLDEELRVKAELEKIARMVVKAENEEQDLKVKLEDMDEIPTADAKSLKREKKLKKREKRIKAEEIKTEPSSEAEFAPAALDEATSDIAAKKARKEARRAKRAAEEAAQSLVSAKQEDKDDALDRRARRRAEKAAKKALEILPDPEIKIEVSDDPPAVVISQEETVAEPVRIVAPLGRANSVRSRYIRQKRLAVMDPQALKEIFMVKG